MDQDRLNNLPAAGGRLHVTDDLPLLLAGEADRATVHRVGDHLRSCTDCRDDLVEAVVSHATLRSAARIAPDIATGGRFPMPVQDLPDHTLPGHDLPGHDLPGHDLPVLDAVAEATPPLELVDLGPVFAQIRAEAAAAARPAAAVVPVAPDDTARPTDELAARRGKRLRYALTAAAAMVVIGGGTAVAVTQLSDNGRSVSVQAFGAGTVGAKAQVGDGWMRLDASSLATLPSTKFYEAWLVNKAGTGVLALGPLGEDHTATYSVPPDVMSQYSTLQVTVQDNNGNPTPSQTSVLRASL